MTEITLQSGRKIGPAHPPFIIAEIGSNWQDLNDCLHSISMAKAAGADAVKFQAYTHSALYGVVGEQPHSLPAAWLQPLTEKARACGIEFMCSAFSPELLDRVNPLVRLHKLASAELTHVRLLERMRDYGKPVVLSTGASGREDVTRALEMLSGVPVVLMYCVAAYPARDVDFRMLGELRNGFGATPGAQRLVGFSDHTTDYGEIPKRAAELGACVIEKHMTDIPDVATPDRPHSLTVDEFKRMVQSIRGTRPFAWGSGEERDMVMRHNRRLIVTRDIAAGDTLEEGVNFGIYRSLKDDARGLSPFRVSMVNGRAAARALAPGEAIGPGDFA